MKTLTTILSALILCVALPARDKAASSSAADSSAARVALADRDEDCDGLHRSGGSIEVLSWSWGTSQSGSSSARGKEKSGHVTLIKRSDASSASFSSRQASRKSGSLVLVDASGTRCVFHDAVVTEVRSADGLDTIVISCVRDPNDQPAPVSRPASRQGSG